MAGYHSLLHGDAPAPVRERAALHWCAWEHAASPLAGGAPNPRYDDPAFRMTFARIVTHFFHHAAWLEPDQLLANAGCLSGIPAVLVHGRLDLGSPLDSAWELAQVWRGAELRIVDHGHTGGPDARRRDRRDRALLPSLPLKGRKRREAHGALLPPSAYGFRADTAQPNSLVLRSMTSSPAAVSRSGSLAGSTGL